MNEPTADEEVDRLIIDVRKLDVQPGDTIVVTIKDHPSLEQLEALRSHLARLFSHVRVLVATEQVGIGVEDGRKRIPIAEFRSEGYLQELNRQFLHPLGLALEVNVHADQTETLGGVWDCREDPEGIVFGADTIDPNLAAHVDLLLADRVDSRADRLGYVVQPVRVVGS